MRSVTSPAPAAASMIDDRNPRSPQRRRTLEELMQARLCRCVCVSSQHINPIPVHTSPLLLYIGCDASEALQSSLLAAGTRVPALCSCSSCAAQLTITLQKRRETVPPIGSSTATPRSHRLHMLVVHVDAITHHYAPYKQSMLSCSAVSMRNVNPK